MPAKHATRPLRPFNSARLVLSFAVAILVLIVMWVAVRAVGPAEARQPSVTLPSMPQIPAPAEVSPSVSPSRSPSPSPSASRASARPTRTPSRPPSPSRSPSPKKTRAPSVLSVRLGVMSSWDQGYIGAARVTNTGTKPVAWKVTVTHSGLKDVHLQGTWNAGGGQSGSSMTFTGGTLAPGKSATFGYQVTKTGDGRARPSGCSVVGGTCSMR